MMSDVVSVRYVLYVVEQYDRFDEFRTRVVTQSFFGGLHWRREYRQISARRVSVQNFMTTYEEL